MNLRLWVILKLSNTNFTNAKALLQDATQNDDAVVSSKFSFGKKGFKYLNILLVMKKSMKK